MVGNPEVITGPVTRPTAAPQPVNCSTNQSKAMMVNWSPRYEMLSLSQSRLNAGRRNGALTATVRAMSRCSSRAHLEQTANLPSGYFLREVETARPIW
jgi:hypothetical protein